MLVEDQPVVARTLCRRLRADIQIRVLTCEDVQGALELVVANGQPSAVILDGSLADGLHGADVLAALRAAGHVGPCAFWTGSEPPEVLQAIETRKLREEPPVFVKDDLIGLMGWIRSLAAADRGKPAASSSSS